MNKVRLKKIVNEAYKNKPIRIMFLLMLILLVIGLLLTFMNSSFKGKMEGVENKIQATQVQLETLQRTVAQAEESPNAEMLEHRFAPYEEIVPFISLLEDLFGLIDAKAKISVKDEERQILVNRYADYVVNLEVGYKKKLFFKALDELYKSKYLTRIMSLNMDYDPIKDEDDSELKNVSFIIRLYFE